MSRAFLGEDAVCALCVCEREGGKGVDLRASGRSDHIENKRA